LSGIFFVSFADRILFYKEYQQRAATCYCVSFIISFIILIVLLTLV